MTRNRDQWVSVADFLTLENLRAVLKKRSAEGAPLAGKVAAQRAASQAIPDGNHGDNRSSHK